MRDFYYTQVQTHRYTQTQTDSAGIALATAFDGGVRAAWWLLSGAEL